MDHIAASVGQHSLIECAIKTAFDHTRRFNCIPSSGSGRNNVCGCNGGVGCGVVFFLIANNVMTSNASSKSAMVAANKLRFALGLPAITTTEMRFYLARFVFLQSF
jgi:hypothetical protein